MSTTNGLMKRTLAVTSMRVITNEAWDTLQCGKGDQTGEDRLRDLRREDLCASPHRSRFCLMLPSM